MRFNRNFRGRGINAQRTTAQRAIAFLRSLGTSAHAWLPGANGVNVASLPSNNYLLSDGSTGYSTVDGVDGLDLDGMGSLGAEKVSNPGPFTATTDWTSASAAAATSAVVGSELQITSTVGYGRQITAIATVVNGTYKASMALRKVSGGGRAFIGWTANSDGSIAIILKNTTSATEVTAEVFFVATSATTYIVAGDDLNVAGTVSGVTLVSVKQVTGTHLTQATTANKPLVRRGMLNELIYAQDFSNAAWNKAGATVGALTTGPDGTLSARQITYAGGADYLYQAIASYPAVTGSSVTIALVVKSALQLLIVGGGTAAGTDVFTSASMGGGWYVQAVTRTFTTTTSALSCQCLSGSIIAGAGTYDHYRGGLFRGSFTAAQILAEGGIPVTTATAASNSSAGKYWWSFDGSNDALALGSVPFEMTDDSVVIVGCRNQGASAVDYMVAIKGANYTNVGSLYFAYGRPGAVWFDNSSGSAEIAHASTLYTPAVITSVKRTNAKQLRINGVQSGATNNTVMGTTTVTNAWIGGGSAISAGVLDSSYYFDGSISIVIVVKGTLTDAELLLLERFAASVTPGAPVF